MRTWTSALRLRISTVCLAMTAGMRLNKSKCSRVCPAFHVALSGKLRRPGPSVPHKQHRLGVKACSEAWFVS